MRTPCTRALPPALLEVARPLAERLGAAGHRTWIVGGAVRDLALGRRPKDLDLTSDATPDEVEALFPDAVDVGRQFGTLLLPVDLGDRGREHAEHTTFRTDSIYRDGRRPEAVRFGRSLGEDAERRDFTCNALYLDPLTDEIADPTGGLADLEAGVLRAVGQPAERFREDALRILRLARFAAGYDLRVEAETAAGARRAIAGLELLPAERIVGELRRMGQGPGASRAAQLLIDLGWISALLPSDSDARPARLAAAQSLPESASWIEWWALLAGPLPLGAAPGAVRAFADRYRLSREEQDAVQALHAGAGSLAEPRTGADLARLARSRFGAHLERVLSAAGDLAPPPCVDQLDDLRRWLAKDPARLHPEPLLAAGDLMALGVERGPALGTWLERLESAQLEGRLTTRAAAEAWVRAGLDE
ncbi:MAG: CCA tRNA nucleotidyltransferase [Planctomycetota bacterium]